MQTLLILFIIFVVFCTFFMLFLQWLSQGSKDPFAKKLRTIGWIGVALGYVAISLGLFVLPIF
jgi:hypothetical protein